jgi:hypothetical protein
MYLLIRYPGEIIAEAVLLAKGKNLLRAVAPGFPDAIELKRAGAGWSTCRGEVVEIDFLMSDEYVGQTLPVRAVAAGR